MLEVIGSEVCLQSLSRKEQEWGESVSLSQGRCCAEERDLKLLSFPPCI